MRSLLFVGLMFLATFSQAQSRYDDSPYRVFDASKNYRSSIELVWQYVDRDKVWRACDAESRRIGNAGFPKEVEACSFQYRTRCVIITAKNVSLHVVGHEILHCFQGNWHPE